MGKVVVGNYPGSIPRRKKLRKKELSRHGHGLRINTLLSVRSICWAKKHDSARSVIFLRNPFFTSSAVFCSVSTIWSDLVAGGTRAWALHRPGPRGKGTSGGREGGGCQRSFSPSHQAGRTPRCRPAARSLMPPKLDQLPPRSLLTASLARASLHANPPS